jgi:hypothetical protein
LLFACEWQPNIATIQDMKYRAVVNVGRNWESQFGQEYRRVAERCVYLEASGAEQAAELAKAVVQAVFPEANVFEVYNVVDERTEPDSVLDFVVGSSATEVLVDQSPIVMWNFRDRKAAEWEARKLTGEHQQTEGR